MSRKKAWRSYRHTGDNRRPYAPPVTPAPQAGLFGRVTQWAAGAIHTISVARQTLSGEGDPQIGPLDSTNRGFDLTRPAGGPTLGAMLNDLNWEAIQAEVEREAQARIVVVGGPGAGKTALLDWMRGPQLDSAHDLDANNAEDAGLFVALRAPFEAVEGGADIGATHENEYALAAWEAEFQAADLVLWLLDSSQELRATERNWICRIRGRGKPLVVALNVKKGVSVLTCERAARALSTPVVPICALNGWNVVEGLLPRMVQTCDRVNMALGRETPAWRPHAARRVIRRSAMLSGLIGAEPIPLLDLPVQVMIQLRALLRIAAIYGENQGDRYGRELLATLISGAGLRILTQQIAKAVPLVGWLCSGGFAAGGAWLIGQSARHYFAHGRRFDIPRPRLVWEQRLGGVLSSEDAAGLDFAPGGEAFGVTLRAAGSEDEPEG